jgi:hypothetical protein
MRRISGCSISMFSILIKKSIKKTDSKVKYFENEHEEAARNMFRHAEAAFSIG